MTQLDHKGHPGQSEPKQADETHPGVPVVDGVVSGSTVPPSTEATKDYRADKIKVLEGLEGDQPSLIVEGRLSQL